MVRAYFNEDRKSHRLTQTVQKLLKKLKIISNLTNLRKDLLMEILGPSPEVIDSMVTVGVSGFWKVTKTAHPDSNLTT